MIKIIESCCRYTGGGFYKVGEIVSNESQFNEKALVEGGFAEYVTEQIQKEEKTKRATKEDKIKLQTKELKFEESTVAE